ncbi:Penicillin amidase [compost metagenome]
MKRMNHRLSLGAVSLAVLALAGCASNAPGVNTPTRPSSSFAVPGLEKPAEVLVDRWGVPHLYAGTLYDAFVAQGFIAARDRLWQMDLWRKRGLGEMAKDFGPAYADGDRMARAVLFRGDMYREWLAYGSDAKRVAEAFVAGVNAYVALTEQKPELLPPEFRKLDYKPARWQAEDIVRIRHHGLTLNFTGEIDRARLFCEARADAVRADWIRRELDPPVEPKLSAGLDPCTVPAAELRRAYELATAAARFPKDAWSGAQNASIPLDQLYALADPSSDTGRSLGSNNWVIGGKRTTTGRPILANDPHRSHGAPSLRYISHLNAPGMSVIGAGEPFLPGISIGHRAAMNRWGAPGENQVYADTGGNIGWIPGGLTVKRPNWDGLTPVPGDGRYEWAGYRNMDELPWAYNPAPGYIVTANENNIPPEHPAAKLGVGYEWSDGSRARRLKAVVGANPRSSVQDSMAWQNDTVSLPAQRVVALLKDVRSDDAQLARGLDLLRGWDGNERADSAAAALFEAWFSKHLRPAVVRAALPADAARLVGAGDAARVVAVLEQPDPWMPVARRNAVMLESLKAAMAEVEGRLGPDPRGWQWGKLHTAVFTHPMDPILNDAERQQFNVNAGPVGGSAFTPMNTSYRNSDFRLTAGASFRMVLDVGNWDGSRVINTPGQSGNPASAHYRDLAPLWAKGEYFPLVYTRKAVEKASRERLELVPQ